MQKCTYAGVAELGKAPFLKRNVLGFKELIGFANMKGTKICACLESTRASGPCRFKTEGIILIGASYACDIRMVSR